MRRRSLFDSLISLEALDMRLSLSPFVSFPTTDPNDPVMPPVQVGRIDLSPMDSGDDPPITQPDLPPIGPTGPGSSS